MIDMAGSMWTTAGLDIQPLMRIHATRWFAALDRSRSDILQWEDWPDAIRSEEDALAVLQRLESDWTSGRTFSCGIFTEDKAVIGGVTVSNVLWDCRCADLGYWVEPAHRGKSISTWAARHVIDFCFGVLKLQRLALVIRVDNIASQRVAQKLGAQFEGIARQRIVHRQRPLDARVYAITRGDTPARDPKSGL